jgi:hypothetical protein
MKKVMAIMPAWITFVAGATFFVLMMPLGEGFDELWHFAYIERVAELGKPPQGHSTHLSKETLTFLQLHPVAWGVHENFPFLRSYEEYWHDPQTRYQLDGELIHLRFSGDYSEIPNDTSTQYEGHQPPLYYFLGAPLFAAVSRHFSFLHTFTAMRMFSILLASLVVPASFLLAQISLKDFSGSANAVALVVLFPGLYPSVARVANDALALPLACWTLFFLISFLERPSRGRLVALQALLIAGLWAKAFFIPIAAGVVLCLVYAGQLRPAVTVLILSMLGAPWYISNLIQTHSVTGLPEEIAGATSTVSMVQVLSRLNWMNLFRVLRSSHIWTGNWSFLGVRGWMYSVIFGVYVMGIVGLIRGRIRNQRAIAALGICYLVFIAALIYYAILVFRTSGLSLTEGWYLAPLIPAEAVLFVAGIQSLFGRHDRRALVVAQLLGLALLLYTAAFVEAPYYAGITNHGSAGQLSAYHPHISDFAFMSARLLRFHPFVPAFLPWLLLSTFGIFGAYSIISNLLRGTRG